MNPVKATVLKNFKSESIQSEKFKIEAEENSTKSTGLGVRDLYSILFLGQIKV